MSQTRPGLNFDPAIEKKLLGGLIFALLIVALMAAAAIQNNSRQAESAAWVNHTHAFILETDGILSSLHAAESEHRVFLLTGDERSRQLSLERFGEVDEHLKVATKLAAGNDAQIKRLDSIALLLQQQIDFNKRAAQLRAQNSAAAAGVFTNAQTRANVVQITSDIAAGKADANQQLHEREQKLNRHTARTEQILYAGAGLNLLLLGLAFYVVRMDLKLRRHATEILEAKVKERTAELAAANDKLQIENLEQRWGQAALGRVVRHHELILNSISEAILVVSRNGHVISMNRAASELLGDVAGKSVATLLGSEWNQPSFQTRVGDIAVRVSAHPARDSENLTGAVLVLTRINA